MAVVVKVVVVYVLAVVAEVLISSLHDCLDARLRWCDKADEDLCEQLRLCFGG